MTYAEEDRLRRKTHQIKKEEKKKNKETNKSKSVWNLDNTVCEELELDFK